MVARFRESVALGWRHGRASNSPPPTAAVDWQAGWMDRRGRPRQTGRQVARGPCRMGTPGPRPRSHLLTCGHVGRAPTRRSGGCHVDRRGRQQPTMAAVPVRADRDVDAVGDAGYHWWSGWPTTVVKLTATPGVTQPRDRPVTASFGCGRGHSGRGEPAGGRRRSGASVCPPRAASLPPRAQSARSSRSEARGSLISSLHRRDPSHGVPCHRRARLCLQRCRCRRRGGSVARGRRPRGEARRKAVSAASRSTPTRIFSPTSRGPSAAAIAGD